MFNLDECLARTYQGITPTHQEILALASLAKMMLSALPNVVNVPAPATIVGDMHGQFHDLIEIFKISGFPPYTNYVFLGDFVDRGYYSTETLCLALLLFIKHPRRVTLLRGNHETRQVTQVYGFYDEILRKYGSAAPWAALVEVFDQIPIACVLNNKIFCIHAGLSPHFETVSDLSILNRKEEIPPSGALSDAVWSDPISGFGFQPSMRGCGCGFGEDVTRKFLKDNGMSLVARGHQMAMDGYAWSHGKQLITIFGAPNYCYRSGNQGAVMIVLEGGDYELVQYSENRERVETAREVVEYFL
ncbi:Serine/threonine-protein phosphatase [Spironucleus salmonicida]|uniref:Serine/threonine-protein phosphatase n=1 Tax=Spironucleus salmonicida TaxID=348837 RepID=V6LUR9_9EUKA|nr:Serine/threonine-protein phosphatase [Spironucleus salmonicida]|eukprot:EST48315.1 Serine/threonine-protein phosphatase [Spironucleus salmonicida]